MNQKTNKTFNIYCDESTHLQNKLHPYMLISYLCCAYPQLKQHKEHLKMLKAKHKIKGEVKWSDVSKSQYPFYSDVIEYFFASDLVFRSVIVDKSQIDENRNDFTKADFYFRMYYQLIFHKINPDYTYNIFLDEKDSQGRYKLKRLKEILSVKNNIRNFQFIKSHESSLMQVADLLMGAINYHIRGENKVIAKNNLIEKIKKYSKIDLTSSTFKSQDKFNLFYIELK